jgi:hypothetical protein
MVAIAQGNNTSFDLNDGSWLRQSIFKPKRAIIPEGGKGIQTKGSMVKDASQPSATFGDTGPGGNRSVNPLPQFTRFADVPLPSLLSGEQPSGKSTPPKTKHLGMGRYYSEAIDSNARRIYMQLGIQTFNSLTNYFTNFYDSSQGNLANTGRVGGFLYQAGTALGYIGVFYTCPPLALGLILAQGIMGAIGVTDRVLADLQHIPLSKYYYVKPTMALYWGAVQFMVNQFAVNLGL